MPIGVYPAFVISMVNVAVPFAFMASAFDCFCTVAIAPFRLLFCHFRIVGMLQNSSNMFALSRQRR